MSGSKLKDKEETRLAMRMGDGFMDIHYTIFSTSVYA